MIPKIDAHLHYFIAHSDSDAMLDDVGVRKLLNIAVSDGPARHWRANSAAYQQLAERQPDRFAWCTTFDPRGTEAADYAERVIAEVEADLDAGAIACKVWKNLGMELRKPNGAHLLVDDPLFIPILRYLQDREVTLLAHIGEPRACWRPLSEPSPHVGYYTAYPKWHMHGRTDMPDHRELVASRDRLLAKYPRLRVVGAHLGSLEYDVAVLAQCLDAHPNFYVDSSARMLDLAWQDSATVRDFFHHYQDRILFGSDIVIWQEIHDLSTAELRAILEEVRGRYLLEASYFEDAGTIDVHGRKVEALNLPAAILEKFYWTNATIAYPGIV